MKIAFFRDFLCHIGYASLVLGGVFVLMEMFVPAFSTPYLHPYAFVVFGLLVSVAFGKQSYEKRGRKWIGIFLFFLLIGALFSQIPLKGSFLLLIASSVILLIVFLIVSMYAD